MGTQRPSTTLVSCTCRARGSRLTSWPRTSGRSWQPTKATLALSATSEPCTCRAGKGWRATQPRAMRKVALRFLHGLFGLLGFTCGIVEASLIWFDSSCTIANLEWYILTCRWFNKAAAQGDADAQFMLANTFYDGDGVAVRTLCDAKCSCTHVPMRKWASNLHWYARLM